MQITIDTADTRSVKALLIAAEAGQWAKCHTRDGRKAYAVPSQTKRGVYHFADCEQCTCVDFQRRREACKHVLAIRLHCALARAVHARPRRALVRS